MTAPLRSRLSIARWRCMVFLATIALTVDLFIKTPKGYFPQDDTG